MKLRPRIKMPTNDSSAVATTGPVLPPNIARLQTPPISELSNAGSTIARKDRLLDLSSSVVDCWDMEATMDLTSPPTKNRDRPQITVPAAPLTKNNLEKVQEEIMSAVDVASEVERSPPTPTPNIRLAQAWHFLLAENQNTCPGFATKLEHIADYVRTMPQETRDLPTSLYNAVDDLIRRHRTRIITGDETSTHQPPQTTAKQGFQPITSLSNSDDSDADQDSTDQADPLKWTHKLDALTNRLRQTPSSRGAHKISLALAHLRDLARPLNGGRLPSAAEAYRLINEQMVQESREDVEPAKKEQEKNDNDNIDPERFWGFLRGLEEEEEEEEGEEQSTSSPNRRVGRPKGAEEATEPVELGQGTLMPWEVRNFDWERDGAGLSENTPDTDVDSDGGEKVNGNDDDNGDAQLLIAETMFLQTLMGEQIRSDLANSNNNSTASTIPSAPPKPTISMSHRFALPRPTPEKLREANELAKSLHLPPDPPTPSPRTALFRKRKFEQESDSDSDEDKEDEIGEEKEEEEKGEGEGEEGEKVGRWSRRREISFPPPPNNNNDEEDIYGTGLMRGIRKRKRKGWYVNYPRVSIFERSGGAGDGDGALQQEQEQDQREGDEELDLIFEWSG